MAIQFQNDLSHWEIVNRSDSDLDFDDDVSVFGVESLDSFSFTYSSSSDDDEKDHDHHDETMRSRSLEIHDVDDAMKEESQSFDDVIGPINHHVVDGVIRGESKTCDDVINPNNRVFVDDEEEEMRKETRSCDDVNDLTYDVGNLSYVDNHVVDDRGKKDLSIDYDGMSLHSRLCDDVIDPNIQYEYNPYKYQNYDHNDDDDENDYEDEKDEYDVDDELVPWGVKDKFERQRIRKLGKRSCVRMMKAKRSALLYTKPGCVRGKHGFGMKVY